MPALETTKAHARRIAFPLVLGILCTIWFALGRDDWKRPVTEPGADAAYYYVYLPSLVLDGDVDFTNQYAISKNWYRLGKTRTGLPSNVFGVGPAVFQLPTFLVGHGLAALTGARSDGYSGWETTLCMWSSIPFSLGALLLAARLARRRVGSKAAAYVGPLVAFVAGPVLYYAVRQPGYAHPYATFAVAWLIERWDASFDQREARSLSTWLVLGAALGLSALARPQLAIWAFLLVIAAIDDLKKTTDRTQLRNVVLAWCAGGAVAAVFLVPQLVVWKVLYGQFYVVPQGPGFMRWDASAWSETLFSSRNGLFAWSPLYLPLLVGLAFVSSRRRLVPALLVGVLLQAFINGAAWDWWGGGSFGGRRFDSTYAVFALGGAGLLGTLLPAIWQGVARHASLQLRAKGIIAALVCGFALLVCMAEVELAADTSVVSARIGGGTPASTVFRDKVRGLGGASAAWLSRIVTAPARLVFAVKHGTSMDLYDRAVGVHYLGETYPGLNAYPDKTTDTVRFPKPGDPRHSGLAWVATGSARLTANEARILVGLNRTGRVKVTMKLTGTGTATLSWNDSKLVETPLSGETLVEATAPDLARGINVLTIEAPIGTLVQEPTLTALP